MQLIINIPEDQYSLIMQSHKSGAACFVEKEAMMYAIKNGTPLPKGHGRLIDADAVLEDPFGNTYKDLDIAETIVEADTESEE